jgi:uncharacterized HAD superfamily protein
LRIGIDVDGVLANFTRGYAELIKQTSGRNLLTAEMIARPPSWNWDRDAGYTKEEETAAWGAINESLTFWADLEPLVRPAIFDALDEIAQENDLYFITTRMGQHPKRQTEWWLASHGIQFPTVLVTAQKGPVAEGLDLEAFLDDRDKNLYEIQDAIPECKLFVLDYPYNQNVTCAQRVHSVEEFIDWL